MKVFTAIVLLGLVACAYCAEMAQDIHDSQMDIEEDSPIREKRLAHFNGFGRNFGGFRGGRFNGGRFGGFNRGRFGNFGFGRGNFRGFGRGGSRFGGRFRG